jgi:hypothetical protein
MKNAEPLAIWLWVAEVTVAVVVAGMVDVTQAGM